MGREGGSISPGHGERKKKDISELAWKCGEEMQREICLNSGRMTFTNSTGSITSRISSSSLRYMTSLGLWTLGQNRSSPITTYNRERHTPVINGTQRRLFQLIVTSPNHHHMHYTDTNILQNQRVYLPLASTTSAWCQHRPTHSIYLLQ